MWACNSWKNLHKTYSKQFNLNNTILFSIIMTQSYIFPQKNRFFHFCSPKMNNIKMFRKRKSILTFDLTLISHIVHSRILKLKNSSQFIYVLCTQWKFLIKKLWTLPRFLRFDFHLSLFTSIFSSLHIVWTRCRENTQNSTISTYTRVEHNEDFDCE